MKIRNTLLGAALGLTLCGAAAAIPYPHGPVTAADLGPAGAVAGSSPVTVTVALNLRDPDQLEQLIEALYTPGSPRYRQFLTPEQFKAQFGPSAASVAAVTRNLESQGLAVTRSATAQLHVTGTVAQLEKAFAVQLHAYEVAASAAAPSYRYFAPLTTPSVSPEIASSVRAVLGLDTRPRFAPRLAHGTQTPQKRQHGPAPDSLDPLGYWTVLDFEQYYNVTPLYPQGIDGQGQTLGIITLASFTPSDAFAYWSALDLSVDANRITQVQVDGGSGAPSDASGSLETTLDVEQTGGIAPGASIIVYEAPNTSQGFVDAFASAVDANLAATVATSWGLWEFFDGPNPEGNGPVTNPTNGRQTTIIDAYTDLLEQAAAQGQSFFAAAGDCGAYDSVCSLPTAPSAGQPYSYNPVVSVDDPGVEPYITVTGATTLAGTQTFSGGSLPAGVTVSVTVPTEQAWSWTYLAPLCLALGQPRECEFPTGTGGGVSTIVPRPFYQYGVPGVAVTPPGQRLYQLTPRPAELIVVLPTGFPGRNTPDISLNGDPDTGYLIYYTSNVNGFGILPFWGGTSFTAQQFNGITTLYAQALHQRVGLLNPALYQIATFGGFSGPGAPLRDITVGNNWYWQARPGYDQTTGVGVPNVANLLEALRNFVY